jgi:nucleoside-diphosphate-sugar epimerase
MAKSLLFIGGTGEISAACVNEALRQGHSVTVLNRGRTTIRPVPGGVETIQADIREPAQVRQAIGSRTFDSVVDFFAFLPDHVEADIEIFAGHTRQYVFVSSASAYQTPPATLPVIESTPLANPYWQYSREKIACEERLRTAAADAGLEWTIVRPSHTYDRTSIPFDGGWTVVDRMRRGEPVVVAGDGTSLWTITHADDVAVGFVGLLGNSAALGETFHITNDAPVTWNRIYQAIGEAAGVEPILRHVASESIAAAEPSWGPRLLGDVSNSMIFDNSKIKEFVPEFAAKIGLDEGAAQIVAWYDENPRFKVIDDEVNRVIDGLLAVHAEFGLRSITTSP